MNANLVGALAPTERRAMGDRRLSDQGGARSARTEDTVLRRIEQAGAIVISVIRMVMGCAPDFQSDGGRQSFAVVHDFTATRV